MSHVRHLFLQVSSQGLPGSRGAPSARLHAGILSKVNTHTSLWPRVLWQAELPLWEHRRPFLALVSCVLSRDGCQADWVRGCQDIWSDTILAVPARVFLDEMNIWIGRLSKADSPHQYGWASSNQLKAHIGQKGLKREGGHLDCLRAETSHLLGSWAFWPVHWNYTIGSPVPIIVWANPFE